MNILLQNTIEKLEEENLSTNWSSFDLKSFSRDKKLWEYQQNALRNAIKVLWKYYEDFVDYRRNEKVEANTERKNKFFQWYKDNGLEENLDIKLDKRNRKIYNLLVNYYAEENKKIPFENFVNRMSFWMATGSGKTLIIIKLVQILSELMNRNEIQSYNILFLTYRDDLIKQFKKLVDEFNEANSGIHISLKDLREYPEVKKDPILFENGEITIFYYRSDNISDEQKEKIVDFKNYDNDGKWFILLDEAHKGEKEDSKRKVIYSILSRNGFLFNFSATFTDINDFVTCAYEFNLSSFINAGYGKHISILEQEIRAFRDKEDYTGEEKQKIVLKSLILLTYVKKIYHQLLNVKKGIYHNPLLLTLVNSVNTKDADLEMFFRELAKIGKGEVSEAIFEDALNELWNELKEEPKFTFEEERLKVDRSTLQSITEKDILQHVYNSTTSGEIEVIKESSNKKEIAFKLKTSDRPFALIKIGDISEWLRTKLQGYEVQERFESKGYFENLNKESSDINILMGSRTFYEGWDSNRPNLINYINIGVGETASKFILQSIGRGIRIEPINNERKRLQYLYINKKVDKDLFDKIKDKVMPIETLFIFGTNAKALKAVVEALKKGSGEETEITLFPNESEIKKHTLLIPIYTYAKVSILNDIKQKMFEISSKDLKILNNFFNFVNDDRIFLMRHNTEPIKIKRVREILKQNDGFKLVQKDSGNIDLLVQRIFDYLSVIPEEFENFKPVEEEINHFKHIKVFLEDATSLKNKINFAENYPNRVKEVKAEYGKIPADEYFKKMKNLLAKKKFSFDHKEIEIRYISNHYYIPILMSDNEGISEYIKHIIKVPSEVKFINDLEDYLAKPNNKFRDFDWWMFSKLDESLDKVYIPYYNPKTNSYSRFLPDFIFWLQKENNYYIIFVDPKGIEHLSNWIYKIDYGYKKLFEVNDGAKTLKYDKFKVKVLLQLRVNDTSKVPKSYEKYWFTNIEDMFLNL